jgi:hypothetical protein
LVANYFVPDIVDEVLQKDVVLQGGLPAEDVLVLQLVTQSSQLVHKIRSAVDIY